jgi:hypothetical protein
MRRITYNVENKYCRTLVEPRVLHLPQLMLRWISLSVSGGRRVMVESRERVLEEHVSGADQKWD